MKRPRGWCYGCKERLGADVPAAHPHGDLCPWHRGVKISNRYPLSAFALERLFRKSPVVARMKEAQA